MNPSGYLYKIFGASPMRPLQQHMAKVYACAAELVPFLEAALKEDWAASQAAQGRISDLENEADTLKKELRLHLPRSLFLPVARTDLLELLRMQDNVANKAKDIAGLVLGRRMKIPADLGDKFLQLLKRCIDAIAQAQKTVDELDELVETGFRGKEVEMVEAMLKELDRLESETDRLQVELRSALYGIEKDLPPVDVMFLYQIIDWTGDLGDLAERVGSRLQLMLAR